MLTLKHVKQELITADVWHNYQFVMVSVDPERDTTERLSSYIPFYDPEFIGLSASVEHTTDFAKNLGILFFKGKSFENGGYDVDHGAAIIMINPQGEYGGVITTPHNQSDISADLIKLADFAGVSKTPKLQTKVTPIVNSTIDSNTSNDASGKKGLSLDSAWVRPAPPQAPSMAAYFDFVNNTDKDIVIIETSSPQFSAAMIHDTTFENGIASMTHLDQLTIPAKSKITLAPSAKHMMLMSPKTELKESDQVSLHFKTDDNVEYQFSVEIKNAPQQ
jgi:copper(I)-binding protein